jgi:shikimate dehydrogenase
MGSAAGTAVRAGLLSEFASLGRGADIVINCTSVGMTPDVDGCPVDPAFLEPRQVVYDIVYQPRETVLLREAERKGCKTIEGIGMLVHQGAASFCTWFGHDPDTDVMLSALGPYGYTRLS